MDALKQLIPLLLSGSLAGLVLTVGLKAAPGDLLYVLRRPALFLKAILAVEVIPPVAAALLVWFLPVEPVVKAGIMLMAISPVPPLVPGQELGVGARKEFAYGLYVAMVLLTLVAVPLAFDLAARLFGHGRTIPFSLVATTVLTGVIAPLAIGVAINRLLPGLAARAAPWIYRISFLLVSLAFIPIIASAWPAIVGLVGDGALLAMVGLVVVTLAGGHLLGGPDPVDRMTLAVASSVRHPGIAMLLANAAFDDKRVSAAVLLFLLVGLVVGTLYKQVFKRRLAAAPRVASPPT
jgi:BASS family bile acid:Na+ symporter